MQMNSYIFPCPKPSYNHGTLNPNILYLPRPASVKEKPPYIPCYFIPAYPPSLRILIMFHGNAEDMGMTVQLCKTIRKYLQINVLSVEFPGYGIYKGKACSKRILQDAYIIYNYLFKNGWESENIVVLGRSIGSGPATWLCMKYKLGGLVLVSPYTSIKCAAKHLLGSFGAFFIADRFKNSKYISKSQCPALIIHGKRDTIIPYKMSQELFDNLNPKMKSRSRLALSKSMEHNTYNMKKDLIKPLKLFSWIIFEKYMEVKEDEVPVFLPDLFLRPLDPKINVKGGDIELLEYPKFWMHADEWEEELVTDTEANSFWDDERTYSQFWEGEEEKENERKSTDTTNKEFIETRKSSIK